jgi:hypothetical protein
MTMRLKAIDDEIHQVEERIAFERASLTEAVAGCQHSLRTAVTSPKSLLAVLGLGFAAGKVLFKNGKHVDPPAKETQKSGLLGLVAGTALSLLQPKLGVGSIVKWGAGRFMKRGGGKSTQAARLSASIR